MAAKPKAAVQLAPDIKELMARPEAELTKPELVALCMFYREQAERLMASTPYQKQRMATNAVAHRILQTLVAPDGSTPPDSPLEALLEAARGVERVAYCHTSDCTSFGVAIACPDCGHAVKLEAPPSWQAAARVLDYVVPKATTNVEQLKDEFLVGAVQAVQDAFDASNDITNPAQRRVKFVAELRQRLSASSA